MDPLSDIEGILFFMDIQKLLEVAKTAAEKAAEKILEIYNSEDFSIEIKSDHSPLTKADKASHDTIVAELKNTGLPILSEEGAQIPFEERKDWDYFWMIDPLDGTKEFIKKNGEFTVNIALIKDGMPILGVVQVPVAKKLYWALDGEAFVHEKASFRKLLVNNISMTQEGLNVVASRFHLNDKTKSFLDQLNNPEIVIMGSSLKLLAIADGTADLYPRFAPTMEWDTAAAQAIVEAAGGSVLQLESNEKVRYNKEDLLNPHFLVTAEIS
ncbi:3'(2'),5'-bisphosphate nucleotidase CysQ [Reichenbachiella versicolor]|uniref:3'(2'),5'-bisphosphate nucleotidase CysQ n=1 Tax=Reichenbachiella versicolor TaxID=1821036 RepID=UPI00293715CB|nr:3'(2'),5'-bisphosphate nucleotidase CysQ [Reichenbachiella versicolor]